jgi:TraK protein
VKISKSLVAVFAIYTISCISHADLIKPETTIAVELSSRDTNRFVCTQGPINDVFYSEEKGIKVQIDGSNAFVKFLVRSNGISNEYITVESEFFISCAGETYTIIGKPNQMISAKTFRLGDSYQKRVDNLSHVFGQLTVEERAVKATEMVYKGDEDMLRKINPDTAFRFWREDILPGATVSNHETYEVDGFGLIVKEFRVEAQRDIHSIQEIQFLNPILSERILAITVIPHALKKGQVGRVFIVEKESDL